MTSLVKAIQERLAKKLYKEANEADDFPIRATFATAAEMVLDADLSDLEPKVVEGATPRTKMEEYSAIANTNSALLANDKQYVVSTDFARKLELELTAAETKVADQAERLRTAQVLLNRAKAREEADSVDIAALTARLEAAEGELNEWEKQAKKFNLDCQDAQSRAFKAERDLEAMRSAERVAKMQERK